MGINLVFPVAGQAVRFGGTFKPFLKIGDVTFIETTLKPFEKWFDKIDKIYFICTDEQESHYNVTSEIKKIIPYDFVKVIKIKEKTGGPYQTLKQGIDQEKITGSCIVCDCDHSLNVDKIFEVSNSQKNLDCIIPTWEIKKQEWMNWSKVVLKNDQIKMICEKERVESEDYDVRGIIGCIYFKDVSNIFYSDSHLYVSDCLQDLLKNQNVKLKTVRIENASFYGDKEMLETHVNTLRKKCTIFCDIDGVLIRHHPHSTSSPQDNEILKGADNLSKWKNDGHTIILTTARNEKFRNQTESLLRFFNISYDKLVMSLPAGPRVLINDHKPSKLFTNQAVDIEVERDKGILDINLENVYKESDTQVKKIFEGGSFAVTYLLNDRVRKHLIKSNCDEVHYEKLKRQVDDLKRFNFLWCGSAPLVLSTKDTRYDFSFDMQHLEGYVNISDLDVCEQKTALSFTLKGMKENVYSLKKEIDGIEWVKNHLENKIFNKLETYSEDSCFDKIINSKKVLINGKEYKGLKQSILDVDKHLIKPKFIRPIHGDFTLENMMWNGENVKLIDMDSSEIFDAAELDLGKMSQSVISKFKDWKNLDIKINIENNSFDCINDYFSFSPEEDLIKMVLSNWQKILNDDNQTVICKAVFYMSMYFIRFVPFRLKISKEHGIFALLMATVWLNNINERLIKNEN